MKPRLIFLDIDGTIVGENHQVSSAVMEQLSRAKENGCLLALATGRPLFAAEHLIELLGINAPSMFFSGSYIINPLSQQIIASTPLSREICERLIGFSQEQELHLELYDSNNYFIEKESELSAIHREYLHQDANVVKLDTLHEEAILKAVIMLRGPELEKNVAGIEEHFSDCTIGIGYGAAHPDITFVNITSAQAIRNVAFHQIIDSLHIRPEEVLSFGDGHADIPFLQLSGTGVAMGTASEDVKKAANFVTGSAEEDGVAAYLSQLF